MSTSLSYRVIESKRARNMTVQKAAEHFDNKKLTALIIGSKVEGIFTEHDIVKLVAQDTDSKKYVQTFVADIMTVGPVCVDCKIPNTQALKIMREAKFRHLPAVKSDGSLDKVLDVVTLGRSLYANERNIVTKMSKKVAAIFSFFTRSTGNAMSAAAPRNDAFAVDWTSVDKHDTLVLCQEDTVLTAAKKMIQRCVSALLVKDSTTGSVIGIVTESDIVRRIVARGGPSNTQLSVIMTKNPTMIEMDNAATSPMSALALMFEKSFRHLPLVRGRQNLPVGVLDVLQLCQGVFGTELSSSRRIGMSDETNPTDWIRRGEDCFYTRVAAASKRGVLEDEEDEEDEEMMEDVTKTKKKTTMPVAPSAPSSSPPSIVLQTESGTPTASSTTAVTAATVASSEMMKVAVSKFRSYLGKARKKRQAAEENAQRNNFEDATKNYGLALRFVSLAQKYIPENKTEGEAVNMMMAARAACVDITLRRLESYRIDGSTKEALDDAKAVLNILNSRTSFTTMQERDIFCNRIGINYTNISSTHVELLIELDRFKDAIIALRQDTTSENDIVHMLSLHLSALKTTSNDLYREGSLHDAVTGYTSALRILLECDESSVNLSTCKDAKRHVLLANRAACYMRFVPRDMKNAQQDLEECVRLEPMYIKGWERLVRLHQECWSKGRKGERQMVSIDETKAKNIARRGLIHHPNSQVLQSALLTTVDNSSMDKENGGQAANTSALTGVLKKAAPELTEPTAEEQVEALKRMMLGL